MRTAPTGIVAIGNVGLLRDRRGGALLKYALLAAAAVGVATTRPSLPIDGLASTYAGLGDMLSHAAGSSSGSGAPSSSPFSVNSIICTVYPAAARC